jgi:periplasmic divalent cation tolerance protein
MDTSVLPDIFVVLCTTPPGISEVIARELLERRLVACVNITSVRSLYRWEGNVCDDAESLLIMKTQASTVPDLIAAIRSVHPYDVPEIIAVPVTAGFQGYLDWVVEETG